MGALLFNRVYIAQSLLCINIHYIIGKHFCDQCSPIAVYISMYASSLTSMSKSKDQFRSQIII